MARGSSMRVVWQQASFDEWLVQLHDYVMTNLEKAMAVENILGGATVVNHLPGSIEHLIVNEHVIVKLSCGHIFGIMWDHAHNYEVGHVVTCPKCPGGKYYGVP